MFRNLLILVLLLSIADVASSADQASIERQGRVMAVGGWQISIQDALGDVEQYVVDPGARIFHNGKPATLDAIDTGDMARLTLKSKQGRLVVVTIDARDRE